MRTPYEAQEVEKKDLGPGVKTRLLEKVQIEAEWPNSSYFQIQGIGQSAHTLDEMGLDIDRCGNRQIAKQLQNNRSPLR